ncbi:MAG: hypothetical protein IT269_02340, partial [Saprospiraceae bacterium]|nr:hypothetical protein [Saprospiraceae bacterium]
MKYLSFTLLFWSFAHILYAQSEQNPEPFGCANQLFWPEFFKNAENAARRDSLESGWQQFSALAQKPADQVLTIPVVFHIIHNNGPENISNAQVLQGLKWLNDAFQNIGYYDQGSGAVTGIQFCLAQRTPQGAASTGILRVQNATLTDVNLETEDLSLKNLSRYFPFHYINIWVVRDVCNNQSCSPGGYAYYPAAHGNLYDGIVIESKTLGTEEWRMSTLIHEMGHYLGLYHTFEGGCTNNDCLTDGDRICDTPPDQSTAAVPCDQTINSCNTDTQSGFATDQPDLNTNYMDYTNYQCVHNFTQGQADRMNFVLNTIRKSLLDSKGCAPPCMTTTTSTFTINPASPVAAGTTVTFTSTAQNAASLQWKVSGQNIGTNTTATYTFDQLGTFPVGLIAQPVDALSCEPSASTKVIEVYCGIDAAFNVGATILQPGQTTLISNQSQGATTYEWYINDVLQNGQLTSVSFNQPGTYLIRLVEKNAWCQDENTVGVQVTPSQNNDDCSERLFEWYFDSLKVVSMVNLVDSGYVVALNNPDTATVGSYLMKITAKGDKVWTKQFPVVWQNLTYYSTIRKLKPGFHNGFWMIGDVFFTSNQATVNSGIVKMTADGDVIWSKKLNVGNAIVQFVDMVELPSGNLAVCGVKTDIPGELYSCYLIMLDANGSKLWERMWKTDNLDALQAISIVALSEGGVAVLCKKLPLEGAVIRINEDGTIVWQKRINVNNLQGFKPTGITQVLDRSIYVCGTSNTEKAGYVFKLTPEGTLSWARRFAVGTTDFGFGSVIPSNVGNGVRLAGWMPDDDLGPSPDGFLMTLSEDGQFYSLTKSSSRLDDRLTLLSGSFVACGSTLLPSGQWRGTLLRTNTNGFYGFCPQDPALVTSTAHNTLVNNINLTTGSGLSLVDEDVTIAGFSISPVVNCQYSCSEICGNNLDDDLDGLFDCLDDDCNCEEDACNPKSSNVWLFGNKA